MVTPAALVVASTVVEYVITAAVGPTVDRGVAATRRAMRRLFRLGAGEGTSEIELTPEQWRHIHSLVVSSAVERGLASDTACQMADAVVGKGVVSSDVR